MPGASQALVRNDARRRSMRLLDAIIDRLADELEDVGGEIEKISSADLRTSKLDARRIPADRLTALLTRIGRTQTLAGQDPLYGGQHRADAELPVAARPQLKAEKAEASSRPDLQPGDRRPCR